MTKVGVQSNEVIYNSVLNAIAKSGHRRAGEQAEKLLQEMITLYTSGKNILVKPDVRTYTCVMEAWMNFKSKYKTSYHTKYIGEKVVSKIDRILQQMKQVSSTTGNMDVEPDIFNYCMLIDALSVCEGQSSCNRALGILDEVEKAYQAGNWKLQPTSHFYNSVLNVIAQSKVPDTSKLLFNVLDRFEDRMNNGDFRIETDTITYSIVLRGMRNDVCDEAAVNRAESILHLILKNVEKRNYKLSTTSFNNTIKIIAKSDIANKAERAWSILEFLKKTQGLQPELAPDLITYNWILHACSLERSEKKDFNPLKTLEIASKSYTELCESQNLFPTSATYSLLLIICRRFILNDFLKRNAMEEIFLRCCYNGRVNKVVVQEIQNGLHEMSFENIFANEDSMQKLPHEWERNEL